MVNQTPHWLAQQKQTKFGQIKTILFSTPEEKDQYPDSRKSQVLAIR